MAGVAINGGICRRFDPAERSARRSGTSATCQIVPEVIAIPAFLPVTILDEVVFKLFIGCYCVLRHCQSNKAFIDIRFRPGLATPRGALYFATLSSCKLIRPTTAKRDVIYKTGSTQRSVTPPEEDRAAATGDVHTNFRADRSSSSRDMLADRQTHRQTG